MRVAWRPDSSDCALTATRFLAVLLLVIGAWGCTGAAFRAASKTACDPNDLSGCIIEDVRIRGNSSVASEDIKERLATTESSHVFGGALEHVPLLSIWDNLTVEYERFDRFVLERDLARVGRFYRARGFYEAQVRAGRVIKLDSGRVRVEIAVEEGIPIRIASVDLAWKDWRFSEDTREVTGAIADLKSRVAIGTVFDETTFETTKRQLLRAMTDRGFAYARVDAHANVDLPTHTVAIVFDLALGPRCEFGPITIEGLKDVPEGPVRASLGVASGQQYSTEALESAEYALASFGVFAAIEVRPRLSRAPPAGKCVVPVTLSVSEAELKMLRAGVGAEIGSRVEAHAIVGWENRNFFGGLRHFSGEIRPGVVFWPNQISDLFRIPMEVVPEVRLSFQLLQPNAIFHRMNAIFSGAFSLYCPLINCRPLNLTEQDLSDEARDAELKAQNLIGYRELSGRVGLDREFVNGKFYGAQFFNVKLYDPFSYNQETLPPGYSSVLVPYLETVATVDLRNGVGGTQNKVAPHSGIYLSADAQLAGGFMGGDADDFRIRPEARVYLPVSPRATLAFRLTGGFLFPRNYGGTLIAETPPLTPAQVVERARDLQILRLRGFFSGGQSSNRGYSYNQIGPNAPSDLVYPLTLQQQRERAALIKSGDRPPDIAQVPVGGLTLWEASLELRLPLWKELGGAIFADASDVTAELVQLRLTHPHFSVGLGLRYDTPVGPFRLDVGYRVPYLQVIGGQSAEGCSTNCPRVVQAEMPPSTFLGLPIAVAIAIGEAF
jgi:outer membrane protein insertion porin family/translocation and assembly module TamA